MSQQGWRYDLTPLVLPIPHPDLAGIVALLWGGDRGVARQQGVDPEAFGVAVGQPEGTLRWCFAKHAAPYDRRLPAALSSLADALEWEYLLEVERGEGGGIRVLGWAAAWGSVGDEDAGGMTVSRGLVRLSRLHPLDDPRRATWEAGKRAARDKRAEAGRAPPGAPGSLSKGEMARRRAR